MKDIEYIRILGFNNKGQKYLNSIKKECNYPIITTFSKGNSKMLEYEKLITSVYSMVLPENEKNKLIISEYSNEPIRK